MNQTEIRVAGQVFEIRSEKSPDHLEEVVGMVEMRIHRFLGPHAGLPKAAILAAVELASELLNERQRVKEFQEDVAVKAEKLLHQVESKLESLG